MELLLKLSPVLSIAHHLLTHPQVIELFDLFLDVVFLDLLQQITALVSLRAHHPASLLARSSNIIHWQARCELRVLFNIQLFLKLEHFL